MKRRNWIMAVLAIAFLVVLNIKISGVGASTSPVNNWYQETGKTQIAHLSTDIHNVNKTESSPSGLSFGLACQRLYSDSVGAAELPQVPNKKLKTEWQTMAAALNSAGDNCIHAEVNTHEGTVSSAQKATIYITATKLYLVTGNRMLVKFAHQMK